MRKNTVNAASSGETETQERWLCLAAAIERLSAARSLDEVVEIVRLSAREIAGADGVTFVLREGALCYYVAENAISPLWAGQRFPMSRCISGWCMLNGQAAAIPDIYADPRIPHDAYKLTFVRSLVMTPVANPPLAAIGAYWAEKRRPSGETIRLLETLARSTAVALANIQLYTSLIASEKQAREQLAELETLYRTAPVGLAMIGPDGRYLRVNEAMAAISGMPAEVHIGRKIGDVLPDLAPSLQGKLEGVLASGDPAGPDEFAAGVPNRAGGSRTWLKSFAPVKDQAGQIKGVTISALEITERKKAEETQRLLINELNHRVKNTLATVQAIARQTHKSSKDIPAFIANLDGRLLALSRSHNLLTQTSWSGAYLEAVIREQMDLPAESQLYMPFAANYLHKQRFKNDFSGPLGASSRAHTVVKK